MDPAVDAIGLDGLVGETTDVFFFQAEDGIRDHCVTGVQTCALPICLWRLQLDNVTDEGAKDAMTESITRVRSVSLIHQQLYRNEDIASIEFGKFANEIGRASCRERV